MMARMSALMRADIRSCLISKVFGRRSQSFSLTALLSGQVDPALIKDKIVLIGVNSESVKDFFYTPHSRGLQVQAHFRDGVARSDRQSIPKVRS